MEENSKNEDKKITMKHHYEKRHSMSVQGWQYAMNRLDLLLISVCGGGLYVSLETLKHSFDRNWNSLWLIKLAGILFLASAISKCMMHTSTKKRGSWGKMLR
jgi:hypothetical protein